MRRSKGRIFLALWTSASLWANFFPFIISKVFLHSLTFLPSRYQNSWLIKNFHLTSVNDMFMYMCLFISFYGNDLYCWEWCQRLKLSKKLILSSFLMSVSEFIVFHFQRQNSDQLPWWKENDLWYMASHYGVWMGTRT